jgi:hypothetical protein
MVLEKLQIIIDADSRGAQKELEKVGTTAQKELGKAETATQRTSAQLKSIGSATALGGLAIVGSLGALAKASDDADKQVAKLESSIQGSTNTFKNNGAELTDLAESLQQVTAADADAIIGTQSLLVQFGLTEDQVKTLTPLVVDLSRKMGVDLDTAAKAVSKAVDGSGGALKKMGINLDESKLAADGFGTTVESLRVAVGGFAQQEGQTFSGQLERLKNNLGDIGETVGKGAANVLGNLAGDAADAASALNEVNPGILQAAGGIGATIGVVATLGGGFATLASVALDFRRDVLDGKTQLVKLGEDGERSLTKVGKAAAGIAVVGAIAGVIETVSAVANSINDIDKKTAAAFDGLRKNVNGTAADLGAAFATLVEVEDESAEFAGIWQGLGSEIQLGNFKADVEEVDAAFTKVLDTLGPEAAQKIINNLRSQNEALDQNSEQYKINADFIAESQKRIDERTEANKQATIAERNQKRATQESVEQYDRETGTLEGVQLSLKDYQDRLKQLTTEYSANTAAAKGFAEQIERGTVADDQISSAISYNEALGKFLFTASLLPRELDAVSIALGGVGTATDTLGEDALKNFLSVADAAKGLLATFIQAGDPEGARQLADQLRNQIAFALAAQGMDPAQIQQFLEASGLTSVQVDAAINFANVEAELLRIQTLIGIFQTALQDAPPQLLLKIDEAVANNNLEQARKLIRGWVESTSTNPETSEIGIKAIVTEVPELKPVLDVAQAEADANPLLVPIKVDETALRNLRDRKLTGIEGTFYLETLIGQDLNGNGVVGRKVGGPVTGKTPYIVGEAGPELFVPNTSGRIVPNNQLAGETNQTFNIYSTDPMLTASEVVRKQRDAAFMAGV